MEELRYDYEFFIWIDGKNSKRCSKIINDLLRCVLSRRHVEENISEKDFGNLREELWHLGFELHEIVRNIHTKKENIK